MQNRKTAHKAAKTNNVDRILTDRQAIGTGARDIILLASTDGHRGRQMRRVTTLYIVGADARSVKPIGLSRVLALHLRNNNAVLILHVHVQSGCLYTP